MLLFSVTTFLLLVSTIDGQCIDSTIPSCVLFKDEFYNLDNWFVSSSNVFINHGLGRCPVPNQSPCLSLDKSPYQYSSYSAFANTSIDTVNASTGVTEIGIQFDCYFYTSSASSIPDYKINLHTMYSCDNYQTSHPILELDADSGPWPSGSQTSINHYFKLNDACIGQIIQIFIELTVWSTSSSTQTRSIFSIDNLKILGRKEEMNSSYSTSTPGAVPYVCGDCDCGDCDCGECICGDCTCPNDCSDLIDGETEESITVVSAESVSNSESADDIKSNVKKAHSYDNNGMDSLGKSNGINNIEIVIICCIGLICLCSILCLTYAYALKCKGVEMYNKHISVDNKDEISEDDIQENDIDAAMTTH